MSTLGLEKLPGRCVHGFAPEQHNTFCACTTGPASEWSVFTTAIRAAAASSADGLVHQRDVRPRVRGRIEPKHIGRCYTRAIQEGLLVRAGHEESDDVAGKNAGRLEPRYELRTAASNARPPLAPTG